jgi:hypothetical protein
VSSSRGLAHPPRIILGRPPPPPPPHRGSSSGPSAPPKATRKPHIPFASSPSPQRHKSKISLEQITRPLTSAASASTSKDATSPSTHVNGQLKRAVPSLTRPRGPQPPPPPPHAGRGAAQTEPDKIVFTSPPIATDDDLITLTEVGLKTCLNGYLYNRIQFCVYLLGPSVHCPSAICRLSQKQTRGQWSRRPPKSRPPSPPPPPPSST